MNLVFISNDEYPDQHAAAIRHSTLARGMVELGHNVYFLLLSPQPWPKSELNYHGVKFKTFNWHHEDDKLLKVFNFYYGLQKLRKRIVQLNSEVGIDAIIVFSVKNQIIRTALSLGLKEQIPVFHERTELPYVFIKKNSIPGRIRYKQYLKSLVPKFDGIFVISDKLKSFFKPYNPSIEKILTVVDTSFFNIRNDSDYDFPYLAYCGNMDLEKDGLEILLDAFSRMRERHPGLKLMLVGDDSDENRKIKLLEIIEGLKLEDRVFFTGQVGREEMPRLLGNARLLVLAKPDNEQNSGNFPIKVGEYLATGVPVVLTTVGEIPLFIKNGETGFLAVPGSVESFHSRMMGALSNYERAKEIGARGRELAVQVFDYKKQATRMLDFINKIITTRNDEGNG
jgi:glycosyltransferase involved in cell wall biosynthesis